jgi:hypothetical protein
MDDCHFNIPKKNKFLFNHIGENKTCDFSKNGHIFYVIKVTLLKT